MKGVILTHPPDTRGSNVLWGIDHDSFARRLARLWPYAALSASWL
jgi:hypothetical protein